MHKHRVAVYNSDLDSVTTVYVAPGSSVKSEISANDWASVPLKKERGQSAGRLHFQPATDEQ